MHLTVYIMLAIRIIFILHFYFGENASPNLFMWVGRSISAPVGLIEKLRPHYEVQHLETYQI